MFKLYYKEGTGAFVVQAVLEECGLDYEKIVVEDPKSTEFLDVNPMGAIPALGLPDGSVITESAAMCLHLTDTNPTAKLMPAPGSNERAHAYRWLLFLATSGYGAVLRRFHPQDNTDDPAGVAAVEEKAARDMRRYLGIVSDAIEEGPFMFGTAYTLVDTYLWMIAAWETASDTLYRDNPKLRRLVREVAKRPVINRLVEEHGAVFRRHLSAVL